MVPPLSVITLNSAGLSDVIKKKKPLKLDLIKNTKVREYRKVKCEKMEDESPVNSSRRAVNTGRTGARGRVCVDPLRFYSESFESSRGVGCFPRCTTWGVAHICCAPSV